MKKKLTKMIGVRVTEGMYGALVEEADRMGLRVADLGRWALAKLLGETLPSVGKWRQAYELWEAWHKQFSYPYCPTYERDEIERCFFCGERLPWNHKEDCIYVKACKLLEVEPQ